MKRFCSKERRTLSPVFSLALFAAAVLLLLRGAGSVASLSAVERRSAAEQAVRRAAVQCYAVEGRYPASVEYLKENYGLAVDDSRYVIHYQRLGANLLPEIAVFPIGDESAGQE